MGLGYWGGGLFVSVDTIGLIISISGGFGSYVNSSVRSVLTIGAMIYGSFWTTNGTISSFGFYSTIGGTIYFDSRGIVFVILVIG